MNNHQAYHRVQTLLGHVDGITPSTIELSPNGTASTTGVFGPSSQTHSFMQKIQSRMGGGKSSSQLAATNQHMVKDDDISLYSPSKHRSGKETLEFHRETMTATLDKFFIPERQAILKKLPEIQSFKTFHSIGLTMPEQRELTHQQVKDFVTHISSYQFSDVINNPLRWVTHLEMLYYHGCTVATKAGVHFGLFGATVMNLGNDSHRQRFMQGIHDLSIRGCFCLTELGHGSNAREIETVAYWDAKTNEFVLSTPTETAQKIYIGNLAQHANWAVVFAQLVVGTKHVGVHAFVIQIRDDKSENLMPNLRILDCGPKAGLNGVDNGRLWLDNYRAPKSALLDKFASINDAGEYVSPISSPLRRFTATIGQLVGGRIIVGQGAVHATKVGLTIAIKYAFSRKQFGPVGKPETPLISFLSHQLRLVPLLAKTYALQFALNKLKAMFGTLNSTSGPEREELSKELHVLAAGLKPMATWHKNEALQTARECCGGMGFLAANRIAILRIDSDIDTTWEGDNTVLLQQVSGSLLKEFKDQFKGDSAPAKFRGLLRYLESETLFSWQTSKLNPNAQQHKSVGKRQLRDVDFYLSAFRFREGRLLRALVNRLGSAKKGVDPFDTWNLAGDLVGELAKSHVERQLLEAFVDEIEQLDTQQATEEQASLIPVLRSLCSIYALTTIQKNMGFYLTFRFFSAATSKSMWDTINSLCAKLAPVSLSLVDAFGIPDTMLAAPIAGDWKEQYTYPNVPGYTKKE